MVMTTVLVQVDSTPDAPAVVEAAFQAARKDGGHVVGLHVEPRAAVHSAAAIVQSRVAVGSPSGDLAVALHEAEREGGVSLQTARHCFERVAERWDAEMRERPPNPGRLTAWFTRAAPGGIETIAERGRVFDLVVMRQPRVDPQHLQRKSLRAVLFNAGRPVLVVPPDHRGMLGRRIVIAWNRSPLSARAAAIARSFFRGAREVGILTIRGNAGSGPSAHDLAEQLAWYGLAPDVIEADLGQRRLGDALQEEAEGFGADLLVMGAYSQSPFRESLTGGVTNYLLGNSRLPLLMTH